MILIRYRGDGTEKTDTEALHLPSAGGVDYTLCGLSTDSDMTTLGTHVKVHSRAVTCPDCVKIIRHCRGVAIRPTEPKTAKSPLSRAF